MTPVSGEHIPVMRDEAVRALAIRPDGVYIDGTFGRGGHARSILDALNADGRLLAFDKDAEAVRVAHQSFGHDMRMDQSHGLSAAQWLADAEEDEIATVLREYGEERFARRIARAIVSRRNESPLQRTSELAELVARACPIKEKHKHPATRTFQGIRIFINRELDDLENCLRDSLEILARGARLVVISFHSLEDRIVKRFMRDAARGPKLPKGLPVRHTEQQGKLRVLGKSQRATDAEISANLRARSAVLRVAEVPA